MKTNITHARASTDAAMNVIEVSNKAKWKKEKKGGASTDASTATHLKRVMSEDLEGLFFLYEAPHFLGQILHSLPLTFSHFI